MNEGCVHAGLKRVAQSPLLACACAPLSVSTVTLRLKVRPEVWAWLDQASREVNTTLTRWRGLCHDISRVNAANTVWNHCNEWAAKAWRPYVGKSKWLSAYDMSRELLTGCGDTFDRIGIDTAQCVAGELATRRNQVKRSRLRFRKSSGSRRSLGWIPFKGVNLRFRETLGVVAPKKPKPPCAPKPKKDETPETLAHRLAQHVQAMAAHEIRVAHWQAAVAALPRKRAICFMGKTVRLFDVDRLFDARSAAGKVRAGSFAQNSLGEWFLNVVVDRHQAQLPPLLGTHSSVGLDPGLLATVTTSTGDNLDASRFYREAQMAIAQCQRRGHKKQAKRIHQQIKYRRQDARNKFVHALVRDHGFIFIGGVSSLKLAKTQMAKSVYDASWGLLKTRLLECGHGAGRQVLIINERNTTRSCSSCGSLSGPTGLASCVVRRWTCSKCGSEHHRDQNAALNIEIRGWQQAASQANAKGVSLFSSSSSRPGMGVREREQDEVFSPVVSADAAKARQG